MPPTLSRESAALQLVEHEPRDEAESEPALFEHFLAARRRARGPIVCVNDRVLLTNAAAARVVRWDDGRALWTWARRALDANDRSVHALRLRDVQFSAQCEAIVVGSEVLAALIRLRAPRAARASFGWESLRESELGIAHHVAEGMTNREIGTRLFMSRHTVDFHLRQIFRKLGIRSRIELTALFVEHAIRATRDE
jgi:DNA-binding CsgD family transcriptional regulator